MAFNAGPAIEKLKSFDVRSIVYYKIQDHEVSVDVLIPKDLKPEGKRPVIVRFHGGFLVSPTYSDKASKQRANQGKRIFGSSLFLGTFQPWIMDLALQYSAVIVSPNYVKLPESNGVDILHNLRSFWGWFRINFESFVTGETNGKVSVDISKTLVIGSSAGGYLAVQSAIREPAGTLKPSSLRTQCSTCKTLFSRTTMSRHRSTCQCYHIRYIKTTSQLSSQGR